MAYLYLDDSKHPDFGFALAAFVICDHDPLDEMVHTFLKYGYDPAAFEFKSHAKMHGEENLQELRSALKSFIAGNCKIALCIASNDKSLGATSLELLARMLKHPNLNQKEHDVYFDEGLFSSPKQAQSLATSAGIDGRCRLNFEQHSHLVLGIQLADLVAHTCSTMLLEKLGHIRKSVTLSIPGDTIYDGLDVELGFELWADIRYCFLSRNKTDPMDDFDFAVVDVHPWGLHIGEEVDDEIRQSAMNRFGEMYLGCIH